MLSGLYELGIGNNFAELWPLLYLHQDTSGAASVKFTYPAYIPPATQIYFQALSADPSAPKLPYPTSNVLPVRTD